ncbi:putative Methyltransferase-like protein 13 A (METTL13A) [Monocercomonoides exilis]|uniref:putative Methyltransferase-like protein 13 A (METTL13A) n=1 Tax=Monocercomonoides exilis TaxID=2049356 RepID=UPI0035594CBC|nr:putative Methyltransferase-like protein 13 A (METTL13A) [Monocercomonoides exilis]|eukprot:MONOS_12393.1-p1 / transcript=MONOS_12393.1 / gene=MONOS_12393 / organism=Monocercomonoides_exilis_PA203 / gene_product=Methyltransferase-like protein 13 A (METTL13A) / transcript_product=Methyltransferase-like protein 13 A (METTL13A) / location=Mono_scaffold00683:938-2454(-) / protein_length=447 / sequence_SO=supercontig / SO=protein_coding / is_pseudo=false
MGKFGDREYWNERYTEEKTPFDWYMRWNDVHKFLKPYVQDDSKVLDLGCGTSKIAEELYNEGKQDITCIDFSEVVIKDMSELHAGKQPHLKYICMDALNLEFPDESFDVIIDKGTSDSVFTGRHSYSKVAKLFAEVSRVLKIGGKYIMITHAHLDRRLAHLSKPQFGWEINHQTYPKFPGAPADQVHYIYVINKVKPFEGIDEKKSLEETFKGLESTEGISKEEVAEIAEERPEEKIEEKKESNEAEEHSVEKEEENETSENKEEISNEKIEESEEEKNEESATLEEEEKEDEEKKEAVDEEKKEEETVKEEEKATTEEEEKQEENQEENAETQETAEASEALEAEEKKDQQSADEEKKEEGEKQEGEEKQTEEDKQENESNAETKESEENKEDGNGNEEEEKKQEETAQQPVEESQQKDEEENGERGEVKEVKEEKEKNEETKTE